MPGRGRLPLVGRRAQFGCVAAAWEDARDGNARFVLVLGEPGSGKTRLIEEFHERYSVSKPFAGRCLDYATAPYAPLEELFAQLHQRDPAILNRHDDVRAALAGLFARGGVPSEHIAKRAAFDAAVQALRLYAARRPVALIIEDAHWSDLASLELLFHVALVASDVRLMVLVTARERELAERHETIGFASRIERLPSSDVVRLDALTGIETDTLIDHEGAALGRRIDARTRASIAEAAGGNALYLRELTRHFALGGDAAERGLPVSLTSTVTARLNTLSEPDRAILRTAAVLGDFDEEVLAATADEPLAAVAGVLRRAVALGVIAAYGGSNLGFTHELIRRAVYEQLLPAERRRLHARLAAQLAAENDPTSVARRALHAWHAGQLDEAARCSLIAGDSAFARFAFEDAAEHYQRAAECSSDPEFSVLDRYARALERASRLFAARTVLRRCLAHAHACEDATLRAGLLIRMARAELGETNTGAAALAVRDAEKLLLGAPPSQEHYAVHVLRAWFAVHNGDVDGAFAALRDAEEFEEFAEPSVRVKAHSVAAVAHGARGDLERWHASQQAVLAAAQSSGDEFDTVKALFAFAMAALRMGETTLAMSLGDRAYDLARARGWLQLVPYSIAAHASAALSAGHLHRARELVELALPRAAEFPRAELLARCVGTVVAVRCDDDEMVERCFRQDVVDGALAGEPWQLVAAVQAMTEKLGAESRTADVRRFLRSVMATLDGGSQLCEILVEIARWGLHEEFPHVLNWIDGAALTRVEAGFPHLYRALIARSAQERVKHARSAGSAFRSVGYRLHEAWAFELANDHAAAREIYASCGALRDVRRIDDAAGTHPRAAAERLTPRETQIAELTVSGLSNREISDTLSVSERTVETHLGAVFAKLNVRTRTQLALVRELISPRAGAEPSTHTARSGAPTAHERT